MTRLDGSAVPFSTRIVWSSVGFYEHIYHNSWDIYVSISTHLPIIIHLTAKSPHNYILSLCCRFIHLHCMRLEQTNLHGPFPLYYLYLSAIRMILVRSTLDSTESMASNTCIFNVFAFRNRLSHMYYQIVNNPNNKIIENIYLLGSVVTR